MVIEKTDGIEVSVVMPCLNEEEAIGICINKIKEVFANYGIKGEIIVADNGSVDRSREISESAGARVVSEPQRGYGAAYLRGFQEAKGKFIVMADSDNTYDLYGIPEFIAQLKAGNDFVIGSRFKGRMKKGAMSWTHRYIGNPILSGMTRLFFHTSLSDIHCGMRAFTMEAYRKMELKSLGMEFATEMVVAALKNNLKVAEVPIDYHLRKGRSKLNSIPDAWRHIRFMLLYSPLWLYFIPGMIGFGLGMFVLLLSAKGPFIFLGRSWDLHVMVFASSLCILSYQILNLGVYAHSYAISQGFLKSEPLMAFFQRRFSLEKGILLGALFFLAGLIINVIIFIDWFSNSFGPLYRIRESILAMTFLAIGLQTIFSSFFISLLFLRKR